MSDNITELNAQDPTVESVIERLGRHTKKIKSITAIVTWEDGSSSVCHDTKQTNRMAFDALVLQNYLLNDMLMRVDGE